MEKAVECFQKAYEGSRSRESLIAYLLAFGVTKTPEEYQNLVRRLGVEKEILKEIKAKLTEFGKKAGDSGGLRKRRQNARKPHQRLPQEHRFLNRFTEIVRNLPD